VIKVKEYNHIGIVVRDLEACKEFYGTLLGLKTIPRPPFNFPGHWYQVGPRCQLHLMVYDETIPKTMRHIALEVENFGETLRELKKKGWKSSRGRVSAMTVPITFSARTRTGIWWRSPTTGKTSALRVIRENPDDHS